MQRRCIIVVQVYIYIMCLYMCTCTFSVQGPTPTRMTQLTYVGGSYCAFERGSAGGAVDPNFSLRSFARSRYCNCDVTSLVLPPTPARSAAVAFLLLAFVLRSVSRFVLCRSDNCWCFCSVSLELNWRLHSRHMSLLKSTSLLSSSDSSPSESSPAPYDATRLLFWSTKKKDES